jgi:hypothetical protein
MADIRVAENVEIVDNSFRSKFSILQGTVKASFAEIGPKQNVSYSFVVSPNELGEFEDLQAAYTFQVKGYKQKAISTGFGPLLILSEVQYQALYANHTKEWSIFLALIFGPVILPWLIYINLSKRLNALAPIKND